MSGAMLIAPLGIRATGTAHAAGHGTSSLWEAVASGRSALRPNDLDWCSLEAWIGRVPDVDVVRLPPALAAWDARIHRLVWLALQSDGLASAVNAARSRHGAHRIGVVVGTSTSGIHATETAYAQRRGTGAWPASFSYRHSHAAESVGRFVAEALQLQGPVAVLTTACSSSTKAFLTAQRWIQADLVDAAVVGGADSLCLTTLHGFDSLQLLSRQPCRPFDAERDGISIGEAAGFVLLDRDPAQLRLLGGGDSSDAYHMSTPHPDGVGAQAAMRMALAAAGIEACDIGYVNAHGTGTRTNDRAESAALNAVFGEAGVPVSSTKGVTGHTLGAAGIIDALITLLALEHRVLPPSAQLRNPDPELAVDIVREPRALAAPCAMSNNFGFGGSNCTLIFGRGD